MNSVQNWIIVDNKMSYGEKFSLWTLVYQEILELEKLEKLVGELGEITSERFALLLELEDQLHTDIGEHISCQDAAH